MNVDEEVAAIRQVQDEPVFGELEEELVAPIVIPTEDVWAEEPPQVEEPAIADIPNDQVRQSRPLSQVMPVPKETPPQVDMAALRSLETAKAAERGDAFKLEELVEPRRAGFFRRKYSTEQLMKWSKRLPGGMALISELPEELDRLAVKSFGNINRVMTSGDGKRDGVLVRELLEMGLKTPMLRDEIYLQVKKQLTACPKVEHTRKGWQVLCGLVMVFPPSKTMEAYIRNWIHGAAVQADQDPRIGTTAAYVDKKLVRLCQTGPRGHLPMVEEVERAMIAPFHPSAFGTTLDELMEHGELVDETGHYPRVLIFLSEAVLSLGGCTTEGIFRVPGDSEAVTALRLRIEQGDYTLPENVRDPAIPGSLLKYWLRDLAEPLIPNAFYDRAMANANSVEGAIGVLDDLPIHNLHVAKYMIKFLQVVGDARYQAVTKMNVSNLAMVFAPNFLRCPSDNPLTILVNSKLEQCFLKTLINYLEA